MNGPSRFYLLIPWKASSFDPGAWTDHAPGHSSDLARAGPPSRDGFQQKNKRRKTPLLSRTWRSLENGPFASIDLPVMNCWLLKSWLSPFLPFLRPPPTFRKGLPIPSRRARACCALYEADDPLRHPVRRLPPLPSFLETYPYISNLLYIISA